MKFAFVGIGALGGYFGGRLAKAGNEVVFLARGATLEALRHDGLRVESVLGDFSLTRVNATDRAEEVGQPDAVFVTTKTWQVPEAAHQILPIVGPGTVVIPLQNGVEAYDQLAEVVGAERVLGGLCHVIAFATAPGVIRHIGPKPLITLGEWDNSRTPRLERLAEALAAAGIDTRVPPDFRAALWEKFMYIAPFGGVGSVTRAPIGEVRSLPETRALLQRAMEEIRSLARAHGIELGEQVVSRLMRLVDSLPADATASMQRDVAAGRPSELAALSGAVVRLGRAKQVNIPVHEFIYAALLPGELRARGELPRQL